ncbi:hypothetical protein T484DRAFT_3213591 [Baffinella frigidus]|nr:hypothetical protein T484DRAFT_3213591 [Cryptophyta sp. CCMP2293]
MASGCVIIHKRLYLYFLALTSESCTAFTEGNAWWPCWSRSVINALFSLSVPQVEHLVKQMREVQRDRQAARARGARARAYVAARCSLPPSSCQLPPLACAPPSPLPREYVAPRCAPSSLLPPARMPPTLTERPNPRFSDLGFTLPARRIRLAVLT